MVGPRRPGGRADEDRGVVGDAAVISLCVPTRGRPERFAHMVASALRTAAGPIEIVAYQDEDDRPYPSVSGVRWVRGPRQLTDEGLVQMAGLWTRAWEAATGNIAMMAADDIVFETDGWDKRVEAAFETVPDRLAMVCTRNGQDDRPLLPFVSREWIDTVGFTPDDLQGWFADEWIWSMAAEIGRVIFLENVMIRHNQFGLDRTYLEGQQARARVGGLGGMRRVFYDVPQVERRDVLVEKLRSAIGERGGRLEPLPKPRWFTDSLEMAAAAREHARLMREETLVVVHCYAGDRAIVKNAMPQFQHHGAPVLVLSPSDAPVRFRQEGVTCRSAGKAAYFGQDSLDRERAHLQLLLEYPQKFFLLNDADSVCLSSTIPRYLYDGAAQGIVYSNEVLDWREHYSPYPKIAMQPPYFLSRESIERMLAVAEGITAHPITPYIDWYLVALVSEAGVPHQSFLDGASFPAWRRGHLPETQELGHDFIHRNDPDGTIHGDEGMRRRVMDGAVLIHSVKHPEVLANLVEAHAVWVRRGCPPPVPVDTGTAVITLDEFVQERISVVEGEGMGFGDSVRV